GGGRRGGGDSISALRASDMRRLDSPATPSTSALMRLARTAPGPRPRAHTRPAAEDRQPAARAGDAGGTRVLVGATQVAITARGMHAATVAIPAIWILAAGFHGRALPGGHVCC